MPTLNLKPTHKPVQEYYTALAQTTQQMSLLHEGAVAPHFANLLRACASRVGWTLQEQFQIPRKGQKPLRADGVLLDDFKLRHGIWEAKDSQDDLAVEVKKKFAQGYPQDNILFQAPRRAILVQNGRTVIDEDISHPETLVDVLQTFFAYQPPEFEQWDRAVAEFKERVPELAGSLLTLIETERKENKKFRDALATFKELMREAINPNISDQAVEEMLIQHLLTERIFRKVFNNPDFAQRNIIAREIEKVIAALTSRSFSRHEFLKKLDRFYGAIETTAATIDEFSEKQDFLNTVYEKFFQGFSIKVADTHGIVYTPQPIVEFMVRSVDDILRREFGKAEGLASEGVAILDPFVGTGNFILRVMRQMPKSQLPHKYKHELLCNEVMLLPYYIASMNIEHEYYELTGKYEPFEGISLVDTFELAEGHQLPLFAPENTQRVQKQKNTPIFVVIGNPPYNANQQNEMDMNKNRQHRKLDARIQETYIRDSISVARTTRKLLFDPYVKAFRFATDRLGEEGIVTFVSNNSFIDQLTFSGMRKHLAKDFDTIYVLDLGGNVRKNPKLSGTTHNVFGIQVGVSINILLRRSGNDRKTVKIYYARLGEDWRKEQRYSFLDENQQVFNIRWKELQVSKNYDWLTDDFDQGFHAHLPIGTSDAKSGNRSYAETIFHTYALGISTNKDAWLYNSQEDMLASYVEKFCRTYNSELDQYQRSGNPDDVRKFVQHDQTKIKWSSLLLDKFKRGNYVEFDLRRIRTALYRPYFKNHVYFDKLLIDAPTLQSSFFPTLESEVENVMICLTGKAPEKPFMVILSKQITDLHVVGAGAGAQCFPFYTYDEDGSNCRENITDWALAQFQALYDPDLTGFPKPVRSPLNKWDIFHYVYALLHHPTYRDTYAANLRRELPRIPFVQPEHFWAFVRAGERLAEIHVNYESQPQYPLTTLENPDLPLDYRVEKMRLSKDKTSLKYNDFLTLGGIPPQVFAYKLGNRSALDWVIDQYQVSTDSRSGITNNPNNPDDETYILRLIKQVITVSLETVEIVNNLPSFDLL
ncbi:MAG: N-6 DNA methylase [Chloroflexi bacterium]|nr:N-6 DNA methylase [Chloroflexota bacterium]MBP8058444.1 N-6 DNA methylase [Chloroflexota bacterium]